MNDMPNHDRTLRQLRIGLVLRVREDECEVLSSGRERLARFAPMFPSPRTERVQPGNIVAMTSTADGVEIVLWRWYDAVVLGEGEHVIRLWEPAHGEVTAQPRPMYRPVRPGSRAYLSAGLPGAEWWVAGPVVAEPEEAEVELEAVAKLYTEHGLWDALE